MIRGIRLSNWKRHQEFEHVFEPGLTFVLGANGRGKSSLLQAMRFALVGSLREMDPRDAVRDDEGPASATLELDGTPPVTITRSVDRRGQVEHRVTGTTATVEDMLRQRFGADPAFLNDLLFLGEGEIYTASTPPSIAGQIARLLGTEGFSALLEQIRTEKKPLAKRQRAQRDELQMSRDEISRLEEQARDLRRQIEELAASEPSVLDEYAHSLGLAERRERWLAARAGGAEWEERFQAFVSTLQPDLLSAVDNTIESVVAAIRRLEQQLERRVRDLATEQGDAAGRVAMTRSFIAALDDTSDAECPLCHQPLDPDHRAQVVASHRSELEELTGREAEIKAALDAETHHLLEVRAKAEGAVALLASRPEAADPQSAPPVDAERQVQGAEEALAELRGRRQAAERELLTVRERQIVNEASQAIERDVIAAFREEALLSVAEEAIEAFLDDIARSVRAPLEEQLAVVWKAYRPDAEWSLALDETGVPCLARGHARRPYAALSGGEKMVASVLLRVALLTSLTRSDVLVLDEPLEHLDARGRRLMISSLYRAVQKGVLNQVIISTYEEGLVRRLLSRSDVHAVWLP